MAEPLKGRDTNELRLKKWPWYHADMGNKLSLEGRKLLEQCGIPASEVDAHIYKVRDEAWEVFPFPCIGEFWFIQFGILQDPRFNDVVNLLKDLCTKHPSHSEGESPAARSSNVVDQIRQNPDLPRLLDIGTCVGQDLRALRQAGVPIHTLYGTDIFAGFEDVGHRLFQDKESFANHFFAADVFEESPQSPLNSTSGLWDVVTATMFTHQFDLARQRVLAGRMVRLLRQRKGSMIIGSSTGQVEAADVPLRPPFRTEEGQSIYRQSKETMHKLWSTAVVESGGSLEHWNISCGYDEQAIIARERELKEKGEVRFFQGEGYRRIFFCVERLQ